jgi:hypothetical protein
MTDESSYKGLRQFGSTEPKRSTLGKAFDPEKKTEEQASSIPPIPATGGDKSEEFKKGLQGRLRGWQGRKTQGYLVETQCRNLSVRSNYHALVGPWSGVLHDPQVLDSCRQVKR